MHLLDKQDKQFTRIQSVEHQGASQPLTQNLNCFKINEQVINFLILQCSLVQLVWNKS